MQKKDLAEWKKATATSRQIRLQNRINAAKGKFPRDFFATPVHAPMLSQLSLLDIFEKGDTATVVHFGKADFGVSSASEVKDNFIVVSFIREAKVWKFDSLRVVKFGDDPEITSSVRNGDLEFLQNKEFQPSGISPSIPTILPLPERIGEIWITAVGFEVSVDVNQGNHATQIANDFGKDIIIGGLKKGPSNLVSLKIKPIPVAEGTKKHLEVAIYAAFDGRSAAVRAFHYRPDVTDISRIPADYTSAFSVNN